MRLPCIFYFMANPQCRAPREKLEIELVNPHVFFRVFRLLLAVARTYSLSSSNLRVSSGTISAGKPADERAYIPVVFRFYGVQWP